MDEEWRDIKGFEGLYQVSNLGNVKSLSRTVICKTGKKQSTKSRILKPIHGRGIRNRYCKVSLCNRGIVTNFQIHRLVAEAFIPNPDNLPEVNHKDENPSNNNVDNLEWCTHKYNMSYGTILERKSKALKGVKRSLEDRLKISKGQIGRKRSYKARASMSKAAKLRCERQKQAKLLGMTYKDYMEKYIK